MKKILLISTIILITFVGLEIYTYIKVNAEIYPISYPTFKGSGIVFDYDKRGIVSKFNRKIKEENIENITRISIPNLDGSHVRDIEVNIIPIKANIHDSSLKILESYIVTYAGVIPKESQKLFKLNGFDISEIIYKPFADDGEIWNRIYTLAKKGEFSWLFTIGYPSHSNGESQYLEIYNKIINSINDSPVIESSNFNVLKFSNNEKWIQEYHKNNSKFQSDLK